MKLERLNYKEITLGEQIEAVAGTKIFIPSRTKPEAEPPPPPPPVFSEEEMKASQLEGYKKGFLEGVQEGRQQAESEQAEVNRQLAGMLEQFVQSVSPVFDNYRQMVLRLQKDLPNVALAIARKVAGDALEKNAEAVISDITMRCCESMINEPELTIVAHESMADTLEHKLQEMAVNLPAVTHIVIVRDPDMPRADCRIEWQNGSMERITTQLWQQVEKAVNNMEIIATRETTAQMEELQAQVSKTNETPSSEKE